MSVVNVSDGHEMHMSALISPWSIIISLSLSSIFVFQMIMFWNCQMFVMLLLSFFLISNNSMYKTSYDVL